MDCAPTQRPVAKLSFLLINVFLLLAPRTASTQQLSGTFPVEERQTAVVRVVPGEFVRARLADGSRAGGPLVGATPVAFTLGPSVAYSDNPSVVRLVTVDSLWVRAYSSRRGAVIGGGLGGLLGLGLGMGVDAGSMCPTTSGTRACAQSAVTSAAAAAAWWLERRAQRFAHCSARRSGRFCRVRQASRDADADPTGCPRAVDIRGSGRSVGVRRSRGRARRIDGRDRGQRARGADSDHIARGDLGTGSRRQDRRRRRHAARNTRWRRVRDAVSCLRSPPQLQNGDHWRWRWRESAGTVGRRSRRPILPAVAAPLLARIIEAEYPAEHPGQGGRDRCPLRRG